MNTAVRLFLTAIALLAMVNHAPADTDRDDAEVVLEADEINSSTVEVDDFVVVVYGKGERQPTSEKWAKLDTITGYVKAVKRRALILSLERYGWPESIALERIQTLTLIASPVSVRTNEMGVGRRIVSKLFSGAALGGISAYLGGAIGGRFESCEEDCVLNGAAIMGVATGYTAGTAYGVSRIDPHDRFFFPLLGSLLGFGTGIWLTSGSRRTLAVHLRRSCRLCDGDVRIVAQAP
ncbi:MAG: hypothetical protein OXE49_12355 [Gemmatimonadetes bacterium]|nr:hypothetical protein [Gemmatimonadota bacterium]